MNSDKFQLNRRRLGPPSNGQTLTAYANWVIKWRWPILLMTLIVVIGAAMGGRLLRFSTNYRVFFSKENPQLNAFEAVQNIYTKTDNVLIVLKPEQGTVFTPDFLAAVRRLTNASWKIPFSTRVDSIANFQHTFANGDDLTVQDLVPKAKFLDWKKSAEIREIALAEPLLVNRSVSKRGAAIGINVTLNLPRKRDDEAETVMTYVRSMVEKFRAEHADIDVAITGIIPLNAAFIEASQSDLRTLIPLMYGLIIATMILLFRSFAGTLSTVIVIGISVITAMGLTGWMGIPLTPVSAIAPTIILTIAIADCVHILVVMLREMRRGAAKRDALVESLRVNFNPVFLTSLTTVIGFLSLNFSDSPPFRHLGNITAMGVSAAWVFSVSTLPAMMAVLPMRVKKRSDGSRTNLERLGEFVIARRRPVLWGMTALVIFLAAWIPRIELNDQFVNYFDTSIPFRRDSDFAMKHLTGIYRIEFSLESGREGGISDPNYLKKVRAFGQWLNGQPEVVHVSSLTDIMRRLNKNLHADDPAFYRLPDNRELAAQYLLLYEMSLPYGLDLNDQINVNKSSLRLVATLGNITTREGRAIKAGAENWLAANFPSVKNPEGTGTFVMFSYVSERNIKSMLTGTLIAFVLISLSLIVFLRHVKLGVISLIPNLIPALMTLGLWGLLVGRIGLASSTVVATSLGIIVDDTVHFLSKYLRARREMGAGPEDAVRYAFSTVGTALWVTSAVLVAGFAILSLSSFEINASMGLLTALAIAFALIADFTLLPALLLTLDKKEIRSNESKVVAEAAF